MNVANEGREQKGGREREKEKEKKRGSGKKHGRKKL